MGFLASIYSCSTMNSKSSGILSSRIGILISVSLYTTEVCILIDKNTKLLKNCKLTACDSTNFYTQNHTH